MNRHLNARAARHALSTRLLAAAILLPVGSLARADVIDIAWDEAGDFEVAAEIAADGFAEVCGPLSREEQVQWAFEASDVLDFNIHYHQGDEVVYPAQIEGTADAAGVLVAPLDQTYCWMWTRRQGTPATVTLRLSH